MRFFLLLIIKANKWLRFPSLLSLSLSPLLPRSFAPRSSYRPLSAARNPRLFAGIAAFVGGIIPYGGAAFALLARLFVASSLVAPLGREGLL